MAPFPVFDTDYVKDVDNLIKTMEDNKEINYDDEPVVACRYCKSLHIVSDELENNVCFKCGSVNELEEFKNINEYLKFKNERT
jgi:CTP:phosphocholine cytidylyltransferase-like protein